VRKFAGLALECYRCQLVSGQEKREWETFSNPLYCTYYKLDTEDGNIHLGLNKDTQYISPILTNITPNTFFEEFLAGLKTSNIV
jgi:hypothetical protein